MPTLPNRKKIHVVNTQKKRRVLVVAHNHPDFFPGGAEIFAHDLFKALKDHTHYAACFMAASGEAGREGTPFAAHNNAVDEFIFAGREYDAFFHSHRRSSFLYEDFRALLKQLRPHVVHFHHTLRVGLEALRIVRDTLPEAKIIYTLHEFVLMCYRDGQMVKTGNNALCHKASPADCHRCFSHITPAQFMMRELFIKAHLELVDLFIAPSEFLATRFVEWGIPAHKMRVKENGRVLAKPAPHRALAKGGTRNRFAFFGQINPYKGATLLMQAAELLKARKAGDFAVDIFGNIDIQTESFKQAFFAQVESCRAQVTFHGKYNNADLPRLMQNVDWVITPSLWWENSPLVIQEAFMHRRPVICSDIGGMAEKVAHEKTGLHFKAGDAAALADAMYRAIQEKPLWPRLVKNITPRLSIEQCARDHAAIYDKV